MTQALAYQARIQPCMKTSFVDSDPGAVLPQPVKEDSKPHQRTQWRMLTTVKYNTISYDDDAMEIYL
jgi:hypothetical protein